MKSLFLVLVYFTYCSVSAQNKFIIRVIDAETSKGIANANVLVVGNESISKSNFLGYVELSTKPSKVFISDISYELVSFELDKKNPNVQIALKPEINNLPPVLITDNMSVEYSYSEDLLQLEEERRDSTKVTIADSEQEPIFPGGMNSFYNYLKKSIPNDLIDRKISSTKVFFTILKNGSVRTDTIISDSPELSKTIEGALENADPWLPALQWETPTTRQYLLSFKWLNAKDYNSVDTISRDDLKKFYMFLADNLKYPRGSFENEVIVTQFMLTHVGSIDGIKIISGDNTDYIGEIQRVLSLFEGFDPIIVNGEYLTKTFTLPIVFKHYESDLSFDKSQKEFINLLSEVVVTTTQKPKN
jgi:hypothetical protein